MHLTQVINDLGPKPMQSSTSTDKSIYAGFSCPLEPLNEDFFTLLATQYASAVIDTFVEHFNAPLSSYPGVISSLQRLSGRDNTFDRIWSPALGMCAKAVISKDFEQAVNAAADLLMHA